MESLTAHDGPKNNFRNASSTTTTTTQQPGALVTFECGHRMWMSPQDYKNRHRGSAFTPDSIYQYTDKAVCRECTQRHNTSPMRSASELGEQVRSITNLQYFSR